MFLHAMQYALELQEHMNVYMVMQETKGSLMRGSQGPAAQKAGHGRQPPV